MRAICSLRITSAAAEGGSACGSRCVCSVLMAGASPAWLAMTAGAGVICRAAACFGGLTMSPRPLMGGGAGVGGGLVGRLLALLLRQDDLQRGQVWFFLRRRTGEHHAEDDDRMHDQRRRHHQAHAIGRGEGAVHGRIPCSCLTAYSATTPLTVPKITAAVINTGKRCSRAACGMNR